MRTPKTTLLVVAWLAIASAACGAEDAAGPRTDERTGAKTGDIPANPASMGTPTGGNPMAGAGPGAQPNPTDVPGNAAGTAAVPPVMAPAAGSGSDSANADAGPSSSSGDAGTPTPSGGCGVPWVADDAQEERSWRGGDPMRVARREIEVNGAQRRYLIAVPTDYDANRAYPLVFGFHGLGGDREQLRGYMNVETPASGQALFIYPEGLLVERSGDTGWNTGADSDDLAFVDALLMQYMTEWCVDEARIFATGHSFGGCMSNAVGCYRGDVFRAIAPVAGCGPFAFRGSAACVGQVATLQIHSPKDTTTDYGSGISGCTTWLRRNHCQEMPACGCHWMEALEDPEDECDQQAQAPYDPGVPIEVMADDDAPPVFREYLGCDSGYPVIFADHYNREDRNNQSERWHNPPPWAPAAIWQFFSTLPAAPETP